MAIELARKELLPRPWGVSDLRPWDKSRSESNESDTIGEIRFERPGAPTETPALLLKLLFTSQPLSIQVHPDDAYAQAMGEPNGKSEAWYVLAAAPDAKVALGLNKPSTPQQLRQAAQDGSLAEIVAWRPVVTDDAIAVPAGTIHAIGAGLVIAEIQQRSDATFRLFDHGRQRELHVERAIAVAAPGPAVPQILPARLTPERSLLVSCPHFVFERIELAADTTWCLDAERETWILIVGGTAIVGLHPISRGDGLFAKADRINVRAGELGLEALVAYASNQPVPNLLQRYQPPGPPDAELGKDNAPSRVQKWPVAMPPASRRLEGPQ